MSTQHCASVGELQDAILQQEQINVFDAFALLYQYCDGRFGSIHYKLRNTRTNKEVIQNSCRLIDSILPSTLHALAPMDMVRRATMAASLSCDGNQVGSDLNCYALLRAIDASYDTMHAKSTSLANFPETPQHLNLNTDIALVYPRRPSPVYGLAQNRIPQSSRSGAKCSLLRTSKDLGNYLKDYMDNLVCLSLPPGYGVDFAAFDSSLRLCFPEDLGNCRIALVPMLDRTKCLETRVFDLDSDGKRPFLCTGLTDAEMIKTHALHVLEELNQKSVAVVVFPELCMAEVVRTAICEALKQNCFPNIKIVVAGALHEELNGQWRNTAYVFGPDGQVLWKQRKFQPYTMKSYQAKCIPSLQRFADHDLYENIATDPKVLVVRDTPLGRISVLICSDLLRSDPHRAMLFDLKANCIIVPAMSGRIDSDFTLAAEEFAEHSQAMILLSNSCALVREDTSHDVGTARRISFAFLPGHPSLVWFSCSVPQGGCTSHQCCGSFILQLGDWPSGFQKRE